MAARCGIELGFLHSGVAQFGCFSCPFRRVSGRNPLGGYRCNDWSQEAKGDAHYFNLVKLAINERTHVVPPSFEYDSSYWCDSALISDHTALTRIILLFTVS
jgi:hypothetical protein